MKRVVLKTPAAAAVLFAFVAATILAGCSEDEQLAPNQPPTVWLSSNPPEGSIASYRIEMVWGGYDPDGEIKYYEYSIAENEDGTFDPADTTGRDKWSKVWGTRREFVFPAPELADTIAHQMVEEFVGTNTFFIRAVDDRGLASPQPAYRSFTARNLSPAVRVTVPRGGSLTPAYVPPVITFRWIADDCVDDFYSVIEPDSVSWILEPTANHNHSYDQTTEYIRNLPVDSHEWDKWGGWQWYGAPRDAGKCWTPPPLNLEAYVFAIRAKDEAGAITPVFDERFNVRRILVSDRIYGPLFTVRNTYIGSITTSMCDGPLTIADMPAGVPVEFCWMADASHYGGVVTGYRYGWDIWDLDDPEQWETDYIPFTGPQACSPPRTYYYGTHIFTVEVIDNYGYCSRVEVKINIFEFTMENNLLVIDDYKESGMMGWDDPYASGLAPSDDQHDQFWEIVLENVAGFSPNTNMLEVHTGETIPLTELAKYKSLIWSVYGHLDAPELSTLHDYIKFIPKDLHTGSGGKRELNILALYMAAGGHLLICGNHPVSMVINGDLTLSAPRFPLIFLYEIGGYQMTPPHPGRPLIGDESFAYKELCLETMDFAHTTQMRRRAPGTVGVEYCFVDGVRTLPPNAERDHTMRAAIPVDPDFPRLELRPEAAGIGKWYHESKRGWDAEVYNPQYFFGLCAYTSPYARNCFEPIYGLECLDTGEPTYGAPVAFWTSAFADRVADAPGAVGARSALFGFPPVYFEPDQVRGAIEAIVFGEWQLPRK